MRNCHIEQIGVTDIVQWFGLMTDLQWDRNSFIPKAIALRKFFEYFQHQNLPVVDPWLIPVPSKQYKLPRVATDEKYSQLLNVIPDNNDPRHIRNKAIISMLWDTGARNGEILSLDMNDIDLQNKRAVISTEKNRGSRPFRELFWTEQTNDNLGRWITKREYLKNKITFAEPNALFISICSSGLNNKQGYRFNIKGTGEMLRRYCNRAGIDYQNAHSFRHRKGHSIIEQGGSSADVMNVLGHASVQSSSIYTMMRGPELEARARKFMVPACG
jgi:integrase/recombinase XerC